MVLVSDQEMSISNFGRLTGLTSKALRIYESEGLLGPTRIDERNGYRWYAADQVDDARLIGLLRGLQMPLDDIRELMRSTARSAA
jgi:DNA-binding transcriptional MerR regulator